MGYRNPILENEMEHGTCKGNLFSGFRVFKILAPFFFGGEGGVPNMWTVMAH